MQVTETLSDGLKRAYAVVLPAADIESRRSQRLAELGKTLKIPGFRPGKVPATVVKQRYGSAVSAEVLEESVNEATRKVLADRGLRAATQPKVELVSLDPAADIEFKFELELLPEITIPDFAAIEITRLKAEPAEEQIAKSLEDLARRQRELVEEPEARPAAAGDFLTIDFVGKVDGVAFPGGTGSDMDVEVSGPGFIPGFTEQMVGLAPGETRTIDVTFPAEYGAKELAGKAATFELTAKKLKRAVVPAIDDELGKKLGFENLDEVKDALKSRFQRELDQLARLRTKRQLLDALARQADFAVPESLVEAEFAQIWQRLEESRKQGEMEADDAGKDEDTLKAEYRGIAERRVRLGLLLSEVGRANGITVGADELNRAVHMEASRYPGQERQVLEFFHKNPQAAEGLRSPIFEEKVVDFVLELAKVTDTIVTPEELAKDPNAAGEPGQTAGEAAAAV
ncbi:Trigger factor [Rhodovastum atsumiense]|uniref:Trigger factor n=1 Tax=Rhodovastum atsumiense TaxID=504468 RepID=A0A5M6J1A8_9PROT|nr:trigger factor [Rhodovastum atsumiense]KAA5614383.1 trigger factor [Rhodovastum atsumiense]CAH2604860.1 Trigger factor [Rhodovastum atsumiense]